MKNSIKTLLAASALAVASGGAFASSVDLSKNSLGSYTTNVSSGMSPVLLTNSDSAGANPAYFELNALQSTKLIVYQFDSNPEQLSGTFRLFADNDSDLGSVNGKFNSADIGASWLVSQPVQDLLGDIPVLAFTYMLTAGQQYVLEITSPYDNISAQVSAVPLPGAALLFGSALLGVGVLRRKKGAVAVA